MDFPRPGKPTDNASAESFNGKVRAECIDQNWFLTLDDARSKCEAFRREYNEERLHSAIGNKSPMELMKAIGQTSAVTQTEGTGICFVFARMVLAGLVQTKGLGSSLCSAM